MKIEPWQETDIIRQWTPTYWKCPDCGGLTATPINKTPEQFHYRFCPCCGARRIEDARQD